MLQKNALFIIVNKTKKHNENAVTHGFQTLLSLGFKYKLTLESCFLKNNSRLSVNFPVLHSFYLL